MLLRHSLPLVVALLSSGTALCHGAEPTAGTLIPYLHVVNHEQHAFNGDTSLHTWTFETDGVEDLTVRLLYIADGKSRSVGKAALARKTPAETRAMGKVLLLVQDGQAFGATGKFSPSLNVVFNEEPLPGQNVTTSSLALEKPGGDIAVQAFGKGELYLRPSRTAFLYQSTFYQPGQTELSVGSELDELVEKSKEGTRFIVVTVDLHPR